MGLMQPQTIYGVHSLTLYDRVDWLPVGIIRILGNLNTSFAGDFNDLNGGSSAFPWDSEAGVLDVSLEGTIKEIPNFAFEKFLGAKVTEVAAEINGNVGAATNQKGLSLVSAAGILAPSAEAGLEGNLKDTTYVLKAVSATEVDVYAMTSVDFVQGADLVYVDDMLKITETPLTIVLAATISIPNTGVELTGGAGAIAMVIGDTAYFTTRKQNSGSDIITVGSSNVLFPEFGAVIASQRKGNGDTFRGQFWRCKAFGLPIGLSEKEWLESDVTIKVLYDCKHDSVGEFKRVRGVGADC